jgi:hypothetical protein
MRITNKKYRLRQGCIGTYTRVYGVFTSADFDEKYYFMGIRF